MSVYNYPAPCAPHYTKPNSVDECILQARRLVQKEHGRAAMGPVKKDDNILILTLPDQDGYVQEAITQALIEAGAAKVDFLFEHELSGREPDIYRVEDGWKRSQDDGLCRECRQHLMKRHLIVTNRANVVAREEVIFPVAWEHHGPLAHQSAYHETMVPWESVGYTRGKGT